MPWLERLPQFQRHALPLDAAAERKAEFVLSLEPFRPDRIAGALEIAELASDPLTPDTKRALAIILGEPTTARARGGLNPQNTPNRTRSSSSK
mgnify:CR=1 FL=1